HGGHYQRPVLFGAHLHGGAAGSGRARALVAHGPGAHGPAGGPAGAGAARALQLRPVGRAGGRGPGRAQPALVGAVLVVAVVALAFDEQGFAAGGVVGVFFEVHLPPGFGGLPEVEGRALLAQVEAFQQILFAQLHLLIKQPAGAIDHEAGQAQSLGGGGHGRPHG
nr:hypothetical protein [Tanacetum cinerariifolium]